MTDPNSAQQPSSPAPSVKTLQPTARKPIGVVFSGLCCTNHLDPLRAIIIPCATHGLIAAGDRPRKNKVTSRPSR